MLKKILYIHLLSILLFSFYFIRSENVNAGENEWDMFIVRGISEDCDTFMPTLENLDEDNIEIKDTVADSATLINSSFEPSIVIFKTCIYVSSEKKIDVGITGDDGVSIYVNDEFVAGRANAEDPMSYGTLQFHKGWNIITALVFNCGGPISLSFDIRIRDHVDIMNSECQ